MNLNFTSEFITLKAIFFVWTFITLILVTIVTKMIATWRVASV